MAEKRMFSNKITQSDAFLSMPASTQNLYWHLNMDADDEGFINRPKSIMRMINANEDDLNLLIVKKFVIPFDMENDTGLREVILVVKHWFLHNTIRKDRMKITNHLDQRNLLGQTENGSYTLLNKGLQPNDNQAATMCPPSVVEISVVEGSLVESSIVEINCSSEFEKSIPFEEIINYLNFKADKKFKTSNKQYKMLILAKFNEGYELEDFKKVIDNKVSEWLSDPKSNSWLRPHTLFGHKFDSYLNQRIVDPSSTSVKSTSIQPVYSEQDNVASLEDIKKFKEYINETKND